MEQVCCLLLLLLPTKDAMCLVRRDGCAGVKPSMGKKN